MRLRRFGQKKISDQQKAYVLTREVRIEIELGIFNLSTNPKKSLWLIDLFHQKLKPKQSQSSSSTTIIISLKSIRGNFTLLELILLVWTLENFADFALSFTFFWHCAYLFFTFDYAMCLYSKLFSFSLHNLFVFSLRMKFLSQLSYSLSFFFVKLDFCSLSKQYLDIVTENANHSGFEVFVSDVRVENHELCLFVSLFRLCLCLFVLPLKS